MQERTDPVSQTGNGVDHTLDHAGNPVDQPLDEIFPPLERLPRQPGDKPDGGRKSIGNHGIQTGKGRADPGDHPLEGGNRRFTQRRGDIYHRGFDSVPDRRRRLLHGGPNLRCKLGQSRKYSFHALLQPRSRGSHRLTDSRPDLGGGISDIVPYIGRIGCKLGEIPRHQVDQQEHRSQDHIFQQFKGAGGNLADPRLDPLQGIFRILPQRSNRCHHQLDNGILQDRIPNIRENADTCDHRPLHQSGIAEKKPMKIWNAAGMVSVKKTTTPFHNSISF